MNQEFSSFKKAICTSEGERLWYADKVDNSIEIYNQSENELLGRLEKLRVGAWMTWCLFLEQDCYMSAGCLDEIREMIRRLNATANKPKRDSKDSEEPKGDSQ